MSKQSDLIETLVEFMRVLNEPIHYKILTDNIIEYGLWVPYGQQPDQIVYSAMHQDVKKRGDMSAFKFMGKGVFVFADVPGADVVELPKIANNTLPKDPAKRAGDLPSETAARREAMAEDARCGNCSSIEYTGIEEYKLSRGECGKWEKSGRCSVSDSAAPCPFWEMRSLAQRSSDTNRRDNLRIFMSKLGYTSPAERKRA